MAKNEPEAAAAAAPKRQTINNRTYEDRGDGRLIEVADPKAHAARLLSELGGGKGHTVTGLRLTQIDNPNEPAVVVTLDESEAKPVVALIREILTTRTK